MDPVELANHLWEKDRIIVVGIQHPEFQGIRVSPSTLEEIDRFADAMERVLAL